MSTIFYSLLGFFSFFSLTLNAQDIPGCTDPQAINYNPLATVNDGSCQYDQTNYNPQLLFNLPQDVNETSGMIVYKGSIWTINDSGNPAVLYRIDSTDGAILQEIAVSGAVNVDWESLAQDEDYIYIGDFGNNEGTRDDLGIYRIKKGELPEEGNGNIASDHLTFVYSDFKNQPGKWRETNFDCEAMIAFGDSLYLFSKNWVDQRTKMYRLPKVPGSYVAELITEFNTEGLITGADLNESSDEVVLLGYTNTYVPFFWILFDYNEKQFFSGNKRRIDMISILATQTESIAYGKSKSGFISNEKTIISPPVARSFNTSIWTDSVETGIHPVSSSDFDFFIAPNPIRKGKLSIIFIGFESGNYHYSLFDMNGNLLNESYCQVVNNRSECKTKIPVENLAAGTYFIRIIAKNTIIEKKFIKQ